MFLGRIGGPGHAASSRRQAIGEGRSWAFIYCKLDFHVEVSLFPPGSMVRFSGFFGSFWDFCCSKSFLSRRDRIWEPKKHPPGN